MSLSITASMIKKLDHQIDEIRLRTLRDIEGKLSRGLKYEQSFQINASNLVIALLRWFNRLPLIEEYKVLNMILTILKSQFGKDVITYVGPEELLKEINRISVVLNKSYYDDIIEDITKTINDFIKFSNYERLIKTSSHNDNIETTTAKDNSNLLLTNSSQSAHYANSALHQKCPCSENSSIQDLQLKSWNGSDSCSSKSSTILTGRTFDIKNSNDCPCEESITSKMNRISDLSQPEEDNINLKTTYDGFSDNFQNDYVHCWEIPNASDYNSLKILNEAIHTEADNDTRIHAMSYLENSIKDNPTEYFLQPPYVFKSLIKLFHSNNQKEQVYKMLILLTKSLMGRIKYRQLAKTRTFNQYKDENRLQCRQISVPYYCSIILTAMLDQLKNFGLATNIKNNNNLNEINNCFILIINIMNLIEVDVFSSYQFLEDFIQNFSLLIKQYRNALSDNFQYDNISRTKYIIALSVLSKLITILKKNDNDLYIIDDNELINQVSSTELIKKYKNQDENELEIGVVDFSIKTLYPDLYKNIKDNLNIVESEENPLSVLLNCEQNFLPAVEILRNPSAYSDEELIFKGIEAVDTLYIHKSIGLVKILLNAISNSALYFDGNTKLKNAGESLLLKLLSHQNLDIQTLVYEYCADKMKYFLNSLIDGETMINNNYTNDEYNTYFMGIPLTVEILTEIICFGCLNENDIVHTNAETIMLMVLRAKTVLGEYWMNIIETLLPVLPLLQCLVTKSSPLGQAVLDILDPNYDLPALAIIQGNIRFLFNPDPVIREEAVTRLIYILSAHPQASLFLPKIQNITDIIPNDICLLDTPINPQSNLTNGLFDISSVNPLLELLKSGSVEPAIRKTSLIQLNIMAQDPVLNKYIHDQNGWILALIAIENALKENHTTDYPDTAIPGIGLLTKTSLQIPKFRHALSQEINIYFLLIRALFLYHNTEILKQDCAIGLFLILFSDYTLGVEPISVPNIFTRIKIPILCQYHWQHSPFDKKSSIEDIFLNYQNEYEMEKKYKSCLKKSSTSLVRKKLENNSNDSIKVIYDSKLSVLNVDSTILSRYLRFSFANQWFDGLDNILGNIKRGKTSNNQLIADYNLLPAKLLSVTNDVIDLSDALDFNDNLQLKSDDINIILATSQLQNIKQELLNIENATNHDSVINALNGIKINLIIKPNCDLNIEHLKIRLRKFILIQPNNESDEILFINVVNLLIRFMELDNENIFMWLLGELQEDYCTFVAIIKSEDSSLQLYHSVIDLLILIIKKAINGVNDDLLVKYYKNRYDFNIKLKKLYIFLFRLTFKFTNHNLKKDDFNKLRLLLKLTRVIITCGEINLDTEKLTYICNKLMLYIASTKSLTQAASEFNKNCLLTICNILTDADQQQIILESKYLRLLSGLCGHPNLEIRSLSWNILAKLSKTLDGAKVIIEELSYLPGGIHACCLSTILDKNEGDIVKEAASCFFATLLNYKKNNKLNINVAPICKERTLTENDDAVELIDQIFKKQQFYKCISESLNYYNNLDIIINTDDNDRKEPITTNYLVKSYCNILINLIDIDQKYVDIICDNCVAYELANILTCSAPLPTKSLFLMLAEICNLMSRCLRYNELFLNRISNHENVITGTLIYLLNLTIYDNYDLYIQQYTTNNVMQVLRLIGNTEIGYQFICNILAENKFQPLLILLYNGLNSNFDSDYNISCMKFLQTFLLMGQNECINFIKFEQLLDVTNIPDDILNTLNENDNDKLEENEKLIKLKNISNSIKSNTSNDDDLTYINYDIIRIVDNKVGSVMLFLRLYNIFDRIFINEKGQNVSTSLKKNCIKTIQILLKTSLNVRVLAKKILFFDKIINRLEIINDCLGVSCNEYTKKYGYNKKNPIVEELQLLIGILIDWFSCDSYQEETVFPKTFIKLWPWTNTNSILLIDFLKALVFLSEDSIAVCRAISKSYSGYPQTALQLIGNIVSAETNRVKHSDEYLELLELSLKIITNCCSCIQGRLQIVKLNLLSNLSRLHPAVTKLQKPWNTITLLWLNFWSIFTRYPESNSVTQLALLTALITRGNGLIRKKSLTIISNMTFQTTNRTSLLASNDFLYILNFILGTDELDDQKVIIIIIWKLIANNFKAKNIIKNCQINDKLKKLKSELIINNEIDNDIYIILEIVLKILIN